MNTIENLIPKLKITPSFLGHLGKYASKALGEDDIKNKHSKGGKFVSEHFKGVKDGLYLAFHKPDIIDQNGNVCSIDEILEDFKNLLLICQYSGEGDLLDRIAAMRAGKGTQKASPVVFWREDNNINFEDIYVLSFAIGLTGKERKNNFESPIHRYCEEHRPDGKRFALAEYSSSNGESGTKAYTVESEIMSYAYLSYDEGKKQYAKIQQILQKSMGVHNVLANTSYDIQPSTN